MDEMTTPTTAEVAEIEAFEKLLDDLIRSVKLADGLRMFSQDRYHDILNQFTAAVAWRARAVELENAINAWLDSESGSGEMANACDRLEELMLEKRLPPAAATKGTEQ